MLEGEYPTAFPLKHQAKDMRLALTLVNRMTLTLPLAELTEQIYRQGADEEWGDFDFSAVKEVKYCGQEDEDL